MGANGSVSSGWRVLAVDPRGPCGGCGIIPFMEYIIAVNGNRLKRGKWVMTRELAASKSRPAELTLINYKTGLVRKIEIIPSENWGGAGLLGLIIAEDTWSTADSRVVRVLSVETNSLAEQAGLQSLDDYLMGTECCIFSGTKGFYKHISKHNDSVVRLRVYNSSLCEVREVKIKSMESNLWGCEFGCGPDHKIPDLTEGSVVEVSKSVAVEISEGCTGIMTAAMATSPRNSDDPILISDLNITLGEPIISFYEDKAKVDNIIPQNPQATSKAEFGG